MQEDNHMTHGKDIPPEEREKWNLDRERDSDALKDYVQVDRVIGMQEDDAGDIEYLVKCMLPAFHACCSQLILQRERALLRLVHLGKWQCDQQYRTERD